MCGLQSVLCYCVEICYGFWSGLLYLLLLVRILRKRRYAVDHDSMSNIGGYIRVSERIDHICGELKSEKELIIMIYE